MATGCQTIKNKSDAVAEKENEKFGQFIGKQVTELKMDLGAPNSNFISFTCLPTKRPNFSFSLSATSSDFFLIVWHPENKIKTINKLKNVFKYFIILPYHLNND